MRHIDGSFFARYLREQKLPEKMMHLQCGNKIDDPDIASVGDDTSNVEDKHLSDEKNKREIECSSPCPMEVGDLQVISLGMGYLYLIKLWFFYYALSCPYIAVFPYACGSVAV